MFMEELLTVEQAAEHLQMHPATLRRLLRNGQLPGVKFGAKDWRIPTSKLKEFIEQALAQQKKPPATEKSRAVTQLRKVRKARKSGD
jgi:excisionase family DNA binding protein